MWRQVWCYTIRLQGVSIVFYSTPIYLFLRVHNLEEEFYTKNCYFLSTLSFRFVPSIDQSATILPREKKRHDIKPDSTSNQQILLPATCFFYPKSLTFLFPSKEIFHKRKKRKIKQSLLCEQISNNNNNKETKRIVKSLELSSYSKILSNRAVQSYPLNRAVQSIKSERHRNPWWERERERQRGEMVPPFHAPYCSCAAFVIRSSQPWRSSASSHPWRSPRGSFGLGSAILPPRIRCSIEL